MKYNFIARLLFLLNVKPRWSKNIIGKYNCGYGTLDHNGFFKYTLYEEIWED